MGRKPTPRTRSVLHPPLKGEGRRAKRAGVGWRTEPHPTPPRPSLSPHWPPPPPPRGGGRGGGGGGPSHTPPRIAFRFAQCDPTLPLQGRVKSAPALCRPHKLNHRSRCPRGRGRPGSR